MARRLLPALLLGLLIGGCGGDAPRPARPRNLLLVVFDTTRPDHLTPYRSKRDTSPRVAELAERGVLCRSAWAQSSLTPISSASLLTGALPSQHRVRSMLATEGSRLAGDLPTLAERLAAAGLVTAGVVSAPTIDSRYGFERGFQSWSQDFSNGVEARLAAGAQNAWQRRGDETTDRALAWLQRTGDAPFALMLHLFDAHDAALVPPLEFLEQHVSFPLPADLDTVQHLRDLRPPAQRIELYDAEIRFMDEQLGRVLDQLASDGRLDSTLVVFTADHGEGLGQHQHWAHGQLWNEHLRVPLILAGPGVPEGVALDERVRLVDVVPTIAELFNLPLGEELAGRSLMPLLRGEREPEPRPLYAEVHHPAHNKSEPDPHQYTLTLGNWKYVHAPTSGNHRLYDLQADPGELENRFAAEPEIAAELRAALEALGDVTGGDAAPESLDPKRLEALRALGYMGAEEGAEHGE